MDIVYKKGEELPLIHCIILDHYMTLLRRGQYYELLRTPQKIKTDLTPPQPLTTYLGR